MANKGERKVKDLMISIEDYGTISPEASISDAFAVLDTGEHRALLVIDENNEAVGQLSYRDVLVGLEPKYATTMWGHSWFTSETFKDYPVFYYEGEFSGQSKAEAQKKVKEIMSPIKVSVDEDATLAEAVHIMVTQNIGRLPVMKDDKLVGMIRLLEIFDEIKKAVKAG